MRKNGKLTAAIIILVFLSMGGFTLFHGKGVPFVKRISGWSIGIYSGDSPIRLGSLEEASNPVLTAEDVTDCKAEYVADPFMIPQGSTWYMFFEVKRTDTGLGEIGLATSKDAKRWIYKGIVLAEPFHLSYPYVFQSGNDFYMVPESAASKSVRLYRATAFPRGWVHVKNLLDNIEVADPCIFYARGGWWMLGATEDNAYLNLYYSEELTGVWKSHPKNPVVYNNKHNARGGGRVVVLDNEIIRYAQDDSDSYGRAVKAFIINELSANEYHEQEISQLVLDASGRGWNADGMHTIDAHRTPDGKWIACVDGRGRALRFGLKY